MQDLGPTTEGRPYLLAIVSSADTIADLPRYQAMQRQLADPAGHVGGGCGPDRTRREGGRADRRQHPRQRDRQQPDGQRPAVLACDVGRCAGEAGARERDPAARPLPEPGRTADDGRLAREDRRHAVRGRTAAGAVPAIRRARQQSRQLHAHAARDALPRAGHVSRLAARGVPRSTPDGQRAGAHLRSPVQESAEPQRGPAGVERGQSAGPGDGRAPAGGRQARRDVGRDLQRLLAGGEQHEPVVAQHGGAAHRGRQRARGVTRLPAHRARRSPAAPRSDRNPAICRSLRHPTCSSG